MYVCACVSACGCMGWCMVCASVCVSGSAEMFLRLRFYVCLRMRGCVCVSLCVCLYVYVSVSVDQHKYSCVHDPAIMFLVSVKSTAVGLCEYVCLCVPASVCVCVSV